MVFQDVLKGLERLKKFDSSQFWGPGGPFLILPKRLWNRAANQSFSDHLASHGVARGVRCGFSGLGPGVLHEERDSG